MAGWVNTWSVHDVIMKQLPRPRRLNACKHKNNSALQKHTVETPQWKTNKVMDSRGLPGGSQQSSGRC